MTDHVGKMLAKLKTNRDRERMIELGVGTVFESRVTGFEAGVVSLASVFRGGKAGTIDSGSLVIVGARSTNDALYHDLESDKDRLTEAGIISVRSIGDCRAPGAIAHAVYSGHECARTIDADEEALPFKVERPSLSL